MVNIISQYGDLVGVFDGNVIVEGSSGNSISDLSYNKITGTWSSSSILSLGTGGGNLDSIIVDSSGNIFGTTSGAIGTVGGGVYGDGTLFEISKTSEGYSSLNTLVNLQKSLPSNFQLYSEDSNGSIFGASTYNENQVLVFTNKNGVYGVSPTPLSSTINANNSAVWASLDGSGNIFLNLNKGIAHGSIWEITNSSTGYSSAAIEIASFTGSDGYTPQGQLVADANGNLFGATVGGGAYGYGTVFEILKTSSGYNSTPMVLSSFNNSPGLPDDPSGGVIMDAKGNIFGETSGGGENNFGTVYEIVKTASGYSNTPVIVASFDSSNGSPAGSLFADSDGNLFGNASNGVFEITNSGFQTGTALSEIAAFQNGTLTNPTTISDTASNISANLNSLQALNAAGDITSVTLTDTGIPSLSLTAGQLSSDMGVLNKIAGYFSLDVVAPTASTKITGFAGHANTVVFNGNASQYTITSDGNGNGFTVKDGSMTDHLSNVTALQFSDYTDIVASQTSPNGGVSSAQVTNLYAAVLARQPDVAGLAYYENVAATNPGISITTYAEWFLSSPEYTNAHTYAQTPAGDAQFITDTYNNLLHRAPEAGAVAWYQTNVIDTYLNGVTPGTTAYTNAELLAHAMVLTYFSASAEFLGDVQVTAQNPSSNQHWLMLV